ncbi:MAG: hypothetical protein KatS3mg118_1070 [Paracoccaceae bacterium]|nr:MAG: hypothetical protein KatS3mg118_1070 [Paracoccaceae bacterium]
MDTHVYNIYRPEALDFGAGTLALAPGYDPRNDLAVLSVSDNDSRFEGDSRQPEDGDDRSQFGELRDLQGNLILGGPSTRVYLEEAYVLAAPDGSRITVYRVEMGTDPGSGGGEGVLVGYVADRVLTPGVTYQVTPHDVTDRTAPTYQELVSVPICFTPGTLIATPAGLRPVEALRPGDAVVTRDHGVQPLRWVGRQHFGAAELAARPVLRPILIRAHAFGPGRPARDMRVSPQHRVLVGGARADLIFGGPEWLAPAIGLVDGRSILRDGAAREVTYVHLLFDRHEVVISDGLETESFHPGQWSLSTLDAAARAEILAIFPGLDRHPAAAGPAARPALTPREARLMRPAMAAAAAG